MSNLIANWLRSRQFYTALKKGNTRLAQELLEETQKVGAKLSLLERVFKDKLHCEKSSAQYEREVLVLREQISQASQTIRELSRANQQVEQQRANVHNQLRQKEQKVVSTQQQLEAHEQEIQGLHNQLKQKEQKVFLTQQQLEAHEQEIEALRKQLNQTSRLLDENFLLLPHQKFTESVEERFRLNEIGENLLQCTSFNKSVFYELEKSLVKYLKVEFERYPQKESLSQDLKTTYYQDILALKRGQDPHYSSYLSPHVYFMNYFLECVYSAYLAWFLVYKSGLLRPKINILDIGAGSGAMIYGLFSLLKSKSDFVSLPQSHISYCSLEQQSLLQHHGLEFWKQYIEPQTTTAINTYCRFNTIDLFTYGDRGHESRELPKKFFDFIVISHCIFADKNQRVKSHKIYHKIFRESLNENGYVLIVVQGRRLFQAYSRNQTENQAQEESLIRKFIDELGLKLEWYKYLTSIGKRLPIGGAEFARFASNNLPIQPHMSTLLRQYLERTYDTNYKLDDYVILAKKEQAQ